MENLDHILDFEIENPYTCLKVMQKIFLEPKMQKTIAENLELSKGNVSRIIKTLRSIGFVQRDENDLYYVRYEFIIRQFLRMMEIFDESDIEQLLNQVWDKRKKIISAEVEKDSKTVRVYANPPLLFAEFLWLGQEDPIRKNDSLYFQFNYMLRSFFWVKWAFKDSFYNWKTPTTIKNRINDATRNYWIEFSNILAEWVKIEGKDEV